VSTAAGSRPRGGAPLGSDRPIAFGEPCDYRLSAGKTPLAAVVATEFNLADADRDNGTTVHGTHVSRWACERAAHRIFEGT
jgi:hypothetical protein